MKADWSIKMAEDESLKGEYLKQVLVEKIKAATVMQSLCPYRSRVLW